MTGPETGQPAPDFTLRGTTGEVRLSDLLRDGPVVLLFYVEDSTPSCTQQVVSFRDEHETLSELGARLIAVSADPVATHERFVERLGGLPFPLLADPDLEVARLYGVADEQFKRSGRAVFVIDQTGLIKARFVPYSIASTEHFLAVFEALGVG
ncbi:MAG TPA: peroxiredoxin [Dehalococcoidia bacterium]|nr:peroxiredoxin [Dehalococcoidia bacterium]